MYAQQQNKFFVLALSNLGLSDTNSMRDLSENFHLMKVVLVHEVHKKDPFFRTYTAVRRTTGWSSFERLF